MVGARRNKVDDKVIRRHFIPEWASHAEMTQSEIARGIGVNRANLSRWFSGLHPSDRHLANLATLFKTEVRGLFMHPVDYKILKRIEPLTDDQKKRALELIELAFSSGSNAPKQ